MPAPGDLSGLTVIAFESRRGDELERMLARHGARVVRAPALQEVPVADTAPAAQLARELTDGRIAALVALTGVGVQRLAAMLRGLGFDPATLLARTRVVARGPKPTAALRTLGITDPVPVTAPYTWRHVLDAVDGIGLAANAMVAVLEYGAPPTALMEGLRTRDLRVLGTAVYRWALPADIGPLRTAAVQLAGGAIDVALFTSAVQVDHLFCVAPDPAALRAGAAGTVIASIGPSCSEALEAHGMRSDLEADPPKLGPLVALVAERARRMLLEKR